MILIHQVDLFFFSFFLEEIEDTKETFRFSKTESCESVKFIEKSDLSHTAREEINDLSNKLDNQSLEVKDVQGALRLQNKMFEAQTAKIVSFILLFLPFFYHKITFAVTSLFMSCTYIRNSSFAIPHFTIKIAHCFCIFQLF